MTKALCTWYLLVVDVVVDVEKSCSEIYLAFVTAVSSRTRFCRGVCGHKELHPAKLWQTAATTATVHSRER